MHIMTWGILTITAAVLASATAAMAAANRKPVRAVVVKRDCTPFNGRYGYYGNPWCQTGPSEAANRRQYGYPAWVSKKYREW